MAKTELLTHARLVELLEYNPETGVFKWRKSGSGRRKDLVAGSQNYGWYRQITIDCVSHMEHRLAWFYVHGVMPEYEIDHRNTIKHDNRIDNLRPVTFAENNQNVPLTKRNKSGVKCVHWNTHSKKWIGHIQANGKRHHIGGFDSIEEAAAAVDAARIRLHGEYANHG